MNSDQMAQCDCNQQEQFWSKRLELGLGFQHLRDMFLYSLASLSGVRYQLKNILHKFSLKGTDSVIQTFIFHILHHCLGLYLMQKMENEVVKDCIIKWSQNFGYHINFTLTQCWVLLYSVFDLLLTRAFKMNFNTEDIQCKKGVQSC